MSRPRRSLAAPVAVLLCALSASSTAFAQAGTIFLVRHAERADTVAGVSPTMAADPDLSEAGHARAASLAVVLKDAGITAIFATDRKRTQQTAAPLARALGIAVTTTGPSDVPALMAKLVNATGNVLIVGHSNTVPDVIKALGVTTPVTIGDAEFDHLFLVDRSTRRLIRLHYQ